MKFNWLRLSSRWGAIALVGFTAIAARAAEDETKELPKAPPRVKVEVGKDVLIESPRGRIAVDGPASANVFGFTQKLSEYWLGLNCSPIEPALRSQLKLAEGEGLVVEGVMPESPAAKGGLQQHDVLISVGDKPLKDAKQLMELLDENKDKELSFAIIRAGEKTTVAITPEKRPEHEHPLRDRLRVLENDPAKMLEQLRTQLENGGGPVRMQFFHPGMVLPQGAQMAAFPDDLAVHIHKAGNKPAEVVVEKGDKKWTVTEDKLGELPDDVRSHVEGLLGRLPMPKFDLEIEPPATGAVNTFTIPLPPPGAIEHRLEEMNRRLNELREDLNSLRERRQERREQRRSSDKPEAAKPEVENKE